MSATSFKGFPANTLKFLKKLKRNNNREWFNKNKGDYESYFLAPALAFIEAMQAPLLKISECFTAVPKKSGGSLMRIYRDTRFSKEKTPYKTNIGIHFRHTQGKDVHAPGYYVHIEPGEVFLGVGIWRPETKALAGIRQLIDEEPAAWKKASAGKAFRDRFELAGESLKRPPRGYDNEHPWIVDLKRKDFIGVQSLADGDIEQASFVKQVADSFKKATPFMKFLCQAIDVPM